MGWVVRGGEEVHVSVSGLPVEVRDDLSLRDGEVSVKKEERCLGSTAPGEERWLLEIFTNKNNCITFTKSIYLNQLPMWF